MTPFKILFCIKIPQFLGDCFCVGYQIDPTLILHFISGYAFTWINPWLSLGILIGMELSDATGSAQGGDILDLSFGILGIAFKLRFNKGK